MGTSEFSSLGADWRVCLCSQIDTPPQIEEAVACGEFMTRLQNFSTATGTDFIAEAPSRRAESSEALVRFFRQSQIALNK